MSKILSLNDIIRLNSFSLYLKLALTPLSSHTETEEIYELGARKCQYLLGSFSAAKPDDN